MPVIVSLLRAVNLAGHNVIQMEALRAICESLGLSGARTYLQSGNVVFKSASRDLTALSKRFEDAIERRFSIRPCVISRTCGEMQDVIARNPFAGRRDVPPNKLLVTFLAGDPVPDASERLAGLTTGGEEIRLDGRHLYIYFRNGVGRSKVSPAVLERATGRPGTARNWNTVTALLKIARDMEALD
jgi:uncharacterized protein (DUF1697 family)